MSAWSRQKTPTAKAKTVPLRTAPRYPTVKADVYRSLEVGERARADLHADVDAICDAEPRARLDREAVGFSPSCRPRDGSTSTDTGALNAVEAASQHPERAVAWLVDATQARLAVRLAAAAAAKHWPPPPPQGTVMSQDGQTVTVGGRSNQVPNCAWCSLPAPSGRDANGVTLARRVGDLAVHAQPCYQQAWREAARARTSTVAVLLVRVRERPA